MSRKLFGTDGIRGVANQGPMTPLMILKFAMAAGIYFKKNDNVVHRVIIAKDTRLSGYMIENALTAGFASVGMEIILVGPIPTPAVSMLIRSLKADLGVMISASHNPYQDNGLKLFNADGFKLTDDIELEIEDLILNHDFNLSLATPDNLGKAKRLDDAQGRYIEHVKRSFPKGLSLNGLRIVVDCANGSAYNIAPTILWELGAEVIKIACEPDGFNINTNCGATAPSMLASKVLETRADIGIAFDGDADRVLIVDEKGKVVDGDNLMALIALQMLKEGTLKNSAVVVTHMTNKAFDQFMGQNGVTVYRADVGDRYVLQLMQEVGANMGGEQSGHIILSDYAASGDGLVAALQVLASLVQIDGPCSKLSHLFSLMPQVNMMVKFDAENPLEKTGIKDELLNLQEREHDIRFLIRKSGTEKKIRILVEGEDRIRINRLAKEAVEIIQSAL